MVDRRIGKARCVQSSVVHPYGLGGTEICVHSFVRDKDEKKGKLGGRRITMQ